MTDQYPQPLILILDDIAMRKPLPFFEFIEQIPEFAAILTAIEHDPIYRDHEILYEPGTPIIKFIQKSAHPELPPGPERLKDVSPPPARVRRLMAP